VLHISRPTATPNAIAMADWVMGALGDSPLAAAQKLQVHVLLHAFIQGLAVNVEAEAQAQGDTGLSEEEHMQRTDAAFSALLATGRYPHFGKLMQQLAQEFTLDFDKLFELGLTTLLDGLAPSVATRRTSRARSERR